MTNKKKNEENDSLREIKMRVVGIGGGGGSIISGVSTTLKKVLFANANTDLHALKDTAKKKKIKSFHFGQKVTGGLGTGMDVELGKKAAKENYGEIKKLFEGQDVVIFVVSLGGGTGSGAIPVFATAAREMGALTYGIFTLPFPFEGEKKMNIAKEAIRKANPHLNAVTILPNENIFEVVDKNTPLKKALEVMNDSLARNLEGLVETIYETGLINIDFADVSTVLESRRGVRKLAYLNTIEADLEKGAKEIVKKAVSNPLYSYNIKNSRGILFNITGGKDIGLLDVASISENISKYTEGNAKIIVGIMQKRKYRDRVKIALLATGCGANYFSEELGVDKKKKPKKKSAKKKTKKSKKNTTTKETTPDKDKPKKEKPSPEEEKKQNPIFPEEKKIDIKEKPEPQSEAEKEILQEEERWEKPTFLRKLNKDDKRS